MKTIGFVGTAKNTGKTTTALHILELVSAAGIPTALTSIGFDGENTDHITGLPKPRYFAGKDVVLATAASLLPAGTAEYTDIQPTGLKTILGEIVIARVKVPGYVVLAGPNRKVDLRIILDKLSHLGIELTIVDGALNRLAALVVADGMVLSTGASFDERIQVIARHAAAMESLYHHPCYAGIHQDSTQVISLCSPAGEIRQMEISSIMDEDHLQRLVGWLTPGQQADCFVPGVFAPHLFEKMVESAPGFLAGKTFIFTSPLSLLASASPEIWRSGISRLQELGGALAYKQSLPLHFMTVNPFYPRYLQKTGSYVAEFIDKVKLLQEVRELITDTPVLDILQPPHPDLLSLCGLSPNLEVKNES